MRIKIKYDDYAYIKRYNKRHLFEKYFCKQLITKNEESYTYHVVSKINMIWYVILCIPFNIISLLYTVIMNIINFDEWVIIPETFKNDSTVYIYPKDEHISGSNASRIFEVLKKYQV